MDVLLVAVKCVFKCVLVLKILTSELTPCTALGGKVLCRRWNCFSAS